MVSRIFLILLLFVGAVSCGGRGVSHSSDAATEEVVAPAPRIVEAPVEYTYKVVNVYPHSTEAYTQGLLWHDGKLYEGTGQHGESCLRITELNGKELRSMPLERQFFGEGIVLLNDKIYQLTWTSGQAFVYDAETFRTTAIFRYQGEGWGLTTDGKSLYMSDGTDKIFVRNPDNFRVERTINVATNRGPVQHVNEMEWIDGKIWANVYLTDSILIINPENGNVEGIVDMSGLQSAEDKTVRTDVLNGIAYDPATGRIFVTGKYWNKLYEIEIHPKK